MEWKDKIYNHEVPPPDNIWDKISHDLDNGDFIVYKQKLLHADVTPPPATWEKISQDLENESFLLFREHLFHTEVKPPIIVWEQISQDLENQELVVFRQQLYHTEHKPPSDAWHAIVSQLSDSKVVPFKRKSNLLIKVLAAAAFVGIMFFAVNTLIFNDENLEPLSAGKQAPLKTEQPQVAEEVVKPENKTIQQAQPKPPYTIASNQRQYKTKESTQDLGEYSFEFESFDIKPSSIALKEKSFTDRMDMTQGMSKKIKNQHGEIREDVSLLDLPNSYFTMMGPNGQTMRVSSKFKTTIQYLNAEGKEELLDVILRESQYWKGIFRDWKEKVGNSSFVPSVDNFMDIAELMKLIQEPEKK